MLHATRHTLAAALTLAAAAGGLYGTGTIGVPTLYAALLAATLTGLAGYIRWDNRHHNPEP